MLVVSSCNDSMLGGWPSLDPRNFSQSKPNDPSSPSKSTPITYHPTHDRTIPPPEQVISSENKNILLRHIYQQAEDKMRNKRDLSSESVTPERACKVPKASSANDNDNNIE